MASTGDLIEGTSCNESENRSFNRIAWFASLILAWLVIAASANPLLHFFPEYHLDWLLTLSYAHDQQLQSGTDIVFTYGPWGFLWGGYYPSTFAAGCVFWLLAASVIWWACVALIRDSRKANINCWCAIAAMCVAILLTGENASHSDVRFFVLPAMLLLGHFLLHKPAPLTRTLLLTAFIAFTGTIKFTYLSLIHI